MKLKLKHMVVDIQSMIDTIGYEQLAEGLYFVGEKKSSKEVEEILQAKLALGHKYLSFGNCPTFDPVHGCQCGKKENDED